MTPRTAAREHRRIAIMPSLLIENIPAPLFERIQRRAEKQKRTPAEVAIEMMEEVVELSEPPLPGAPFLTAEISAPFDLPRPEGEIVDPSRIIYVKDYVPEPHDVDLPDAE